MNGPVPAPAPVSLTARSLVLELTALWTAVTAILLVAVDLSHLRVPFAYRGDALFYGMNAQAIIESGWMQGSERLGAPFGQSLLDFPLGGDNGNYLIMWALAVFTQDAGLLLNLFFLGTFYLVSASAWLSVRLLGARGLVAVTVGLLFSFAYFHFARFGHLMLANYWVVPIGVVLAVYAARGRTIGSLRSRSGVLRSGLIALGCVVVGSFGAYYAVFAAITIVIMCLASGIGHRSIRPLLHGAGVTAAIAAVFSANLLGSVLHMAAHGTNRVASMRTISDLRAYGLEPVELIRPIPWSRVDVLAPLFADLPRLSTEGDAAALGVIGVLALAAVFVWVAGALVSPARAAGGSPVLGLLATSVVAWLMIAPQGGLYVLAWLGGFEWLRALNRSSVLILFLVLAWLAVAATPALAQIRRRRGAAVASLIVVAVGLVGLLDQVPDSRFPQDHRATAKAYWHDQNVFGELERTLPRHSSVLQLPARHFPGAVPRWRSADYDLLKPYLHTTHLRFSYAGVQGRESEWQLDVEGITGRTLVQVATAMGFDAILIDRWGYPDGAAEHRSSLARLLGAGATQELDDRWLAFDLTRWHQTHAASTTLRNRILATPRVNPGECAPWITTDPGGELPSTFKCPASGSFFVTTPRPTRQSTARLLVKAPGGDGTLTLRWDGHVRTIALTGGDVRRVALPIGRQRHTAIEFSTTAPRANSPKKQRAYVLQIRPEPAPWRPEPVASGSPSTGEKRAKLTP